MIVYAIASDGTLRGRNAVRFNCRRLFLAESSRPPSRPVAPTGQSKRCAKAAPYGPIGGSPYTGRIEAAPTR